MVYEDSGKPYGAGDEEACGEMSADATEHNNDQSQIPEDNEDESQVPTYIEAENTEHDHDEPQESNVDESPTIAVHDINDYDAESEGRCR